MERREPQVTLGPKAILGEGPSWNARSNQLYWVDIKGHQLHVYDPLSQTTKTYDMGQFTAAVVPREKGGVVLALHHGFYAMDLDTGELTLIQQVETDPKIRFNDGKCDPAGRFWAGTMSVDKQRGKGKLYCMDVDGSVRVMLEGVTISNGLGWSPDHQTMYYIDTPTREVVAFTYDVETGDIGNKRVVVQLGDEEGNPDGMTVDAEGMLWVAHWGGSNCTRWDPNTGKRVSTIRLPVPCVTSCVFGGRDLTTLYITTAQTPEDKQPLARHELEGRLFYLEQTVTGLPTYSFKG